MNSSQTKDSDEAASAKLIKYNKHIDEQQQTTKTTNSNSTTMAISNIESNKPAPDDDARSAAEPSDVDGCGLHHRQAAVRFAADQTGVNSNHLKSLSVSNLLSEQEKEALQEAQAVTVALAPSSGHKKASNKWPWLYDSATKCSAPNLNQQKPPKLNSGEPFQILWRRLKFEVHPSAYDQLVGLSVAKLACFCTAKLRQSVSASSAHEDVALPLECIESNTGSKQQATAQANLDKTDTQLAKVVFENLNGYVKSGEITAILGPSGSGKTSLLNALCGQKSENYRGKIMLSGADTRRMRLSIIPQKDYLVENLTVRENLLFASQILNTEPSFDHEANIRRVARMLNLTACYHASAAKISGGEYKRVTIAQELLRQPDILVLDEPTSGLDSMNCKNLIQSLAKLIQASREGSINPMAIVMTIHQPDVDIFQMFDHVYCMARKGRVIFDGKPSEVLTTIQQQASSVLPSEASLVSNPANLLIEIASEDLYGQEPIDKLAKYHVEKFERTYPPEIDIYLGPSLNLSVQAARKRGTQATKTNGLKSIREDEKQQVHKARMSYASLANSEPTGESYLFRDKRLTQRKNVHAGKFWRHTGLLAKRAFTSTLRDPLMTFISLVFHLMIPFVMWIVYSQNTGSVRACPIVQRDLEMISLVSNNTLALMNDQQEQLISALEASTMFFLSTYSFSMCSLSMAALAFPTGMHVLSKETRNGWYSLQSFVFAKTIADFLFEVLFPIFSLVMIYIMLGMPTSYLMWRLWAMAAVMGLISMISHTQGLIFGALCMNSVQTAIFLASASTLPQIMLSGFTARIKNMPYILQKLSWVSVYRYSSDLINLIRFGFGLCPCDDDIDDYLRNSQPTFTDVSPSMKFGARAFLLDAYNSTSGTNSSSAGSTAPAAIGNELTITGAERQAMINKLQAEEIDMFDQMAQMVSRSFTFGRNIDGCDTVRSQLLNTTGAPPDHMLPYIFGGMVGLLMLGKVLLFLVVKFKLGKTI